MYITLYYATPNINPTPTHTLIQTINLTLNQQPGPPSRTPYTTVELSEVFLHENLTRELGYFQV